MISALKSLRLPVWCRGNIGWLLAGRAVRSFTQAALSVAVPLYVAAAGFSVLQVGYLLSIGSLGSIAMVLTIGFVADRYGRKPLLLWIAVLSAVGTAVYAVTASFWPLAIMGAISSVGRGGSAGSGGNWGPFYPAEQPLVASSCANEHRNAAFAAISFVGSLAAAAGSLVAILPALLVAHLHMTAVDSFRPLFWICTVCSAALVLLVLPIREQRVPAAHRDARLSRASTSLILRLWVTNGLNGFAFGILGPFLTYWFFVRYGVGAAALGSLYTLINLMTAFPVLGSAWIARRLGAVRSVTFVRAGTALFVVLMALAPTYLLAAATYVVRMVINSIGMPIRQSFVMGVSEERSRSSVAAFGNLPAQFTATVSPTVGSYLLAQVSEEAPIWFAAAVLALSGAAFFGLFRDMKPPEESSPAAGATGRLTEGSAAR